MYSSSVKHTFNNILECGRPAAIRILFLLVINLINTAVAQERPLDSLSIRQDYTLPSPVRYEAYYDVATGKYHLYPKVGSITVGAPTVMSPEEYRAYMLSTQLAEYYRQKSDDNNIVFRKDEKEAEKRGLIPAVKINNRLFESIFGSNKIEIIPQGFASFDLGALHQKIDNPMILPQNRSSFAIDIQQRIQLGLTGKVGDNLQLRANYDTQSGFAFENKLNVAWQARGTWRDLQNKGLNDRTTGGEDKIIKKVEFGNVNLPLSTSLIRGSESLFGLKTQFQLGKTLGTVVLSQQQGEARNIVVQGGGAVQTFKINASDYEDNQHYFLGHYFLDNYDRALQDYPLINSAISINRIEVWVLEQGSGNLQEQKSILGIRDLGEGASGYPDNSQNGLYQNIAGLGTSVRDVNLAYNAVLGQNFPNAAGAPERYTDGEQFIFNRRARRLQTNEFNYNPQLGYISLNQRLNDNQLLAVAYSYTVNGQKTVYKVGEFSDESPVLIVKLLKPNSTVRTSSPMWDLMMKNIYPMEANQISADQFMLNVYYRDSQAGKVNYLPGTAVQDVQLLKLFNWDRLNINNDMSGDGVAGDGLFDFVPGITINANDGKLIFTKAKPFGSYLENVLGSSDPKFVFNDLYTMQKEVAAQQNLAQRYTIEGRYKGAQGSGISLGAINVPRGSVKVTSNGQQLMEGVDYTVDYMLGSVNIINEALKNSGQAINVSLENQLTFNTQRRSFMGLNLERQFNERLLLGTTIVNYSEKPITQKVNFGNEAVNNTMAGFNLMYNNEFPFLTRLTDKIPLVKTDAASRLNFRAEGAYLIPGQDKNAGNQSYIDDFEQSSTKISLKEPGLWGLASKPEQNRNDPQYANAGLVNDVREGYGRGLLSWYNIDPRFYGVGGKAPAGINAEAVSNHASRRVQTSELMNNRDFVAGEQTYTNTLDITFYPKERGPYNLNPIDEPANQRWAGLMRPISVSNFTGSNIEYVEFWLMDPYADGRNLGASPKLKLHLGNVSEDVLKDGKLMYENGMPTASSAVSTSTSNWGVQPNQFPVLYAFSTEGEERRAQDVGYDGLNNEQEAQKFGTGYINPITGEPDPAADDFVFYLSNKFTGAQASSVTERYKYFRNPDGNSQSGSLEVATQMPDAEDINHDYNLDLNENYNQYTINLDRNSLAVNRNFIVDEKEVPVRFQNGQKGRNKWYLFRVPVQQFDTNAGAASEDVLNNVRFARIILDGFDDTATLRFGTLDLVRSEWRKYNKNIVAGSLPGAADNEGSMLVDNENFFVGSVNLEENALGAPPYVMPPGIDRQVLQTAGGMQRQNEASLYLKVTNLKNEARAVVKNTFVDMRRYRKLEMFVHAEDIRGTGTSSQLDRDMKFFVRFGSDATDNYYEYEASLKYTPRTARTATEIWPLENMVNINLQDFVDAKIKRDQAGGNLIGSRFLYAEASDGDRKIFVKGRPVLGNITTMMIGVRNTSGVGKDVVLWVNEMRISGIENEGGYAANASLDFNLGDFAMVNAGGAYSTVDFGSIISKPAERNQSTNSALNISTTVNLDKFIPEKVGMRIPVNYTYAQTIEDPKYNPIDIDVEFEKAANREELKQVARTYTQQRSIGVVNMRKERTNTERKSRFYDVENLALTLNYSDDYYRDVYTTKNYRQYLRGNLDYNYSFRPWVLKPFNKMVSDTAKSAKYLQWFKEFNFNPVPTRISVRTELDRNYNELQFRNIEALMNGVAGSDFDVIRNRAFYFGWQYAVGFNFTRSLKLEINSATRTLNDNISPTAMDSRSIFEQPFRSGRPVLYNHRVQLNYRLPFEYLPFMNFLTAEVGYGFQYNWNARSTVLTQSNAGNLGNLAQNTNTIVGTATANIPQFLNNFAYFRKIEEVRNKRRQEIDSLNNAYAESALKKSKKNKFFVFNTYKGYTFKNRLTPMQTVASALFSGRQLDINYNENNGTVLPGILSSPNFYGYGQNIGGPTAGFLLGSQADIRRTAIERGWISSSPYMNDPYSQQNSKSFDANLQLSPLNDLRIDINALWRHNRNLMQGGYNLDADPATPYFDFAFENELVTHSKSVWLLSTSFKNSGDLFPRIIENARALSQQMGTVPGAAGFAQGYSLGNAYVLVPAFRAAVEGRSLEPMDNPKKSGFPLPNWNVVYSGFRNLPVVASQFSKFDILHSYKSTYTGTGVQSNIDYYNDPGGFDVNGDRLNPYIFSQVGYVESFAPLIGGDFTLRNNMQFRAMYNRDRMLLLGLVNNTLTEDYSKEYVFGFGYIVKDLRMKLNMGGKPRNVVSDLNVRADFSLRDSETRITNILLEDSQVTGGQKLLGIKFSADYNVSENFNLRFFYDQLATKYKISTAYPLSTIRAGLSATFNFNGGIR